MPTGEMSYSQFTRLLREHAKKIDDARLLTSSEKDQRKQGFRLLVIDMRHVFGVAESQIVKDCGLE